MRVSFHSVNDSDEKVYFESDAYYDNGLLRFKDKSYEDTEMMMEITSSFLRIQRVGKVNMNLVLKLGQKTVSRYKNENGLSFEFTVLCTNLKIEENKILAEYDMLIDNNLLSKHKIWVLIH